MYVSIGQSRGGRTCKRITSEDSVPNANVQRERKYKSGCDNLKIV